MDKSLYYPFSENPIVETDDFYKLTREISLKKLREKIRKERLKKSHLIIVK